MENCRKYYFNRFFFIIILILTTISNSNANEQEKKLSDLFNKLKTNNNKLSYEIEQKIWKIWSTHPSDEKLTLMLTEGSNLVNKKMLNEAIIIFTKVIDLDPKWAEAWNKRATVLYMVGQFQKSQNDIDKVLELEKRHFGALAGQGLVNIQLENYEKAIISYQKVQIIYPAMKSPKVMIKQINELIKRQSI